MHVMNQWHSWEMLDPASATVAFVGFAGSLAALSGAAINGLRTLKNVCQQLKDAPDDIKHLTVTVTQLERLITRVETASKTIDQNEAIHECLECLDGWEEDVQLAQKDFHTLQTISRRLEKSLASRSGTGQNFTTRLRQSFACDEIRKYESRLGRHIQAFSLMLALLSEFVGSVLGRWPFL